MPLNYLRAGNIDSQYPPVVLLHGLFGSSENLGLLARALYPEFDVISVDLPNHGRSPHTETFNYPAMVSALLGLLEQLNIDQCLLLGHSMGGKVAMQLAVEHPQRVAKLLVADIAPVKYPPQHNQIIAALQSLDFSQIKDRKAADLALQSDIPEAGVRQFLLKSLEKTDQGLAWRFNLTVIAQQYANINQGLTADASYLGPTLFVKGANSDYIKADYRDDIQRYFPNSKAHIIQGTGHWLHAEKPDVFNRIVRRFFFT